MIIAILSGPSPQPDDFHTPLWVGPLEAFIAANRGALGEDTLSSVAEGLRGDEVVFLVGPIVLPGLARKPRVVTAMTDAARLRKAAALAGCAVQREVA